MACTCGSGKKTSLVYACSGAANTGLLADQIARKLNAAGLGNMTCLAGLGADLDGFITSAEASDRNIVLDGCAVACGTKIFSKLGLPCQSLILTDFGVKKGETPITAELIDQITGKLNEVLA